MGEAADPSVRDRLERMTVARDMWEQMGMFSCGIDKRNRDRDDAFVAEVLKLGAKAVPELKNLLEEIWQDPNGSRFTWASGMIHRAYGEVGGRKVLPHLLARMDLNGGAGLYGGIAEAADLNAFRWITPKLPMYIRCEKRSTPSALLELIDRWYGGQTEEFERLLGPKSAAEMRRLGLRFVTPPEDESLWMGVRMVDAGKGEYEFVDRELAPCGKVKLQALDEWRGPAFEFDDLAGLVRTIEGCAARSRRPGARTDVFYLQ